MFFSDPPSKRLRSRIAFPTISITAASRFRTVTNKSTCNRWDARHFVMCELVASWSEDSSRKVGAIVVGGGNETIGIGFNGLPRNVDSTPAHRHDRATGEKYLWYEHAERNALYNTIRAGGRVSGATMYCSSFPCADCARAIIQTGILALKTFSYDPSDPFYAKHFVAAETMLLEAGIDLKIFNRDDDEITRARHAFTSLHSPQSGHLR